MKKAEVEVGKVYLCNHSSGRVFVRILIEFQPRSFGSYHPKTHWRALNLKTNREIELKSAAKLIRPATTQEVVANFGV